MHHVLSYDTIVMMHPTTEPYRIVGNIRRQFPNKQPYTDPEKPPKRAMYKTIELRASSAGLRVSNSLATLHKGNNIHSLTHSEFCEAVESLGKVLGVDLSGASVTRADIAGNIELCQYAILGGAVVRGGVSRAPVTGQAVSVPEYFSSLGKLSRFNRKDVNGETLTYYLESNSHSKGEVFQLEDKLKEMVDHGDADEIPEELTGKRVVRIELSLRGKVKLAELNGGAVTVASLMNERFYKLMCERWYERYTAIERKPYAIPMNIVPKTRDSILYDLAATGLAQYEVGYIDDMIKAMPNRTKTEKSERYKASTLIYSTLERRTGATSGDYYDELTKGVEHLYRSAVR
jgi:hypothetical protein